MGKTQSLKKNNTIFHSVGGMRLACMFLSLIMIISGVIIPRSAFSEVTYFDIDVKVSWVDGEDGAGGRSSFVTVALLANDAPAVDINGDPVPDLVLDSENDWSGTFCDLPEKDASNEAIVYRVRESGLHEGYTPEYFPEYLVWTDYTPEFNIVNVTEKDLLKGRLIVTKQDEETREPLPGAVFTLSSNTDARVYTGTTGADGTYTFIVPCGAYTLKEVKAPAGYMKDDIARIINLVEDSDDTDGVQPGRMSLSGTRKNASQDALGAPLRSAGLPEEPLAWSGFGQNLRWAVTDEGVLYVAPAEGYASGTLPNNTSNRLDIWPWDAIRESITGAVFIDGVETGTNAGRMFENCGNLVSADVSGLDISAAETMRDMFANCTSLEELKGADNLKTTSARLVQRMFQNCTSLESISMPGFYFGKNGQLQIQNMFDGCEALESVVMGGFDEIGVTNNHIMREAFRNCTKLSYLEIGSLADAVQTGGSIDASRMFQNCTSLTSTLAMTGIVTPMLTVDNMYSGCKNITSADLSGISVDGTLGMNSMFSGCSALKTVNFKNTSAHTLNAPSAFDGCESLEEAVFENCTVSWILNANYMFRGCRRLVGLDLSSVSPEDTFMGNYMFQDCYDMLALDLSGLGSFLSRCQMNGIFENLTGLETLLIPNVVMTTPYNVGLRTLYSLDYLDVSNARLYLTRSTDFNSRFFMADGMFLWEPDGNEYSAREIAELIVSSVDGEGVLPKGTYTRKSPMAKGFEKMPFTDYVVTHIRGGDMVTITYPTDGDYQLYKDTDGSIYLYSGAHSPDDWLDDSTDNKYTIEGPVVVTYKDAVSNSSGERFDLKVTIDKFTITNVSEGVNKAINTGGYSGLSDKTFKRTLLFIGADGTFQLANFILTNDAKANPSTASISDGGFKLNSGPSGTYVDINLEVVGAEDDETLLLMVKDLDLGDGFGTYGEGSEGALLREGVDLDSVTIADHTGLRRFKGFGSDYIPDSNGAYITGSGVDGDYSYSRFFAKGSAVDMNFTTTTGNAGDVFLFDTTGSFVPVLFEKVDADTQERSPLEGALLEIFNNNYVYSQWKTTLKPQGVFFRPGEYVIREVYAPNGRKLAENISFKILFNGMVYINGKLWDDPEVIASVVVENSYSVTKEVTVFNKKLTKLTILRPDGMSEQDFWYVVTDSVTGQKTEVCIPVGEDRVTVTNVIAGRTYYVEEMTDWSWRYTADAQMDQAASGSEAFPAGKAVAGIVPVNDPAKNIVAYKGERTDNAWLDGYHRENNLFTLRISDPVTQDTWADHLINNTEKTGRIWSDKSVTTAASTTIKTLDYPGVTVDKSPDADFLVDFSMYSSTVKEDVYTEGSPIQSGGGSDGYVVYTDRLGEYMTLEDVNALVLGGGVFRDPVRTVDGDKVTYTFAGSVQSNLTGGQVPLSELIIEVEKGGSLRDGDVVTVKVPESLVPLREFDVRVDSEGKATMAINRVRPLHLFYSTTVKPELKDYLRGDRDALTGPEVNDWQAYVADPDNLGEGGRTVVFRDSIWSGDCNVGDTTVSFKPSASNHYYYFMNDTPVKDVNGKKLTGYDETSKAQLIADIEADPGNFNFYVYHYEFYDARLSTGQMPTTGVYYDARKVSDTRGAKYTFADVDPAVLDDFLNNSLEWITEGTGGSWHIKSGSLKEINRHFQDADKEENRTGTADTVYRSTIDSDGVVTDYLGNCGLVFVDYKIS